MSKCTYKWNEHRTIEVPKIEGLIRDQIIRIILLDSPFPTLVALMIAFVILTNLTRFVAKKTCFFRPVSLVVQ